MYPGKLLTEGKLAAFHSEGTRLSASALHMHFCRSAVRDCRSAAQESAAQQIGSVRCTSQSNNVSQPNTVTTACY